MAGGSGGCPAGGGEGRVERAFLFFVDGIGLGPPAGPAREGNPFLRAGLPLWTRLAGGPPGVDWDPGEPVRPGAWEGGPACTVRVDATLGVPGLPQSATGQTALYTGRNAAALLGRHLSAQPTPTLVGLLRRENLLLQLAARGLPVACLNAYRPEFFRWYVPGEAGTPAGRRRPFPGVRRYRPSAGTVAADAAGIRLRDFADAWRGEALFHDIDHTLARSLGYDLPPLDPLEAGRRAARVAARHVLTVYEHYQTDLLGHRGDLWEGVAALERIEGFLTGFLGEWEAERGLLVLVSDHGNLEDCRHGRHTANPVGAYLAGAGADRLAASLRSLTDLAPGLCGILLQESIGK